MPDLETRLPDLLRHAAGGPQPEPSFDRRVLRRARRRRVVNASMAGLAALALVAGTVLGAREVVRSNGTISLDESPTPGPGVVTTPLDAVWPETTAEALGATQARADAGEVAWRLDPVQTAAAFATDVLGWDATDVLAEETGRPRSGTAFVSISNLGVGPAEGASTPAPPETVLTLQRLGETGEAGVWSVTLADTRHILIVMFNEPAGQLFPVGSLTDIPEEWQLGIWPIVEGHLVVEGIITEGTGGRVQLDGSSFSAPLHVPRSLVPEGTTIIGILLGLWDPEGTIVAAEAFPYDVTTLGWESTGATGATGSGATGSTGSGLTGATGPVAEVPTSVLATRDAIAVAAETRDFDGLETLIDPDHFSYNFDDGSNPIPEWRKDSAVLDTLATILQMPFTTNREAYPDVAEGSQTVYIWPSLMGSDLTDLSAEERDMLDTLGITERGVQDMLDAFGGYVGPRTGIAQDGTWVFYTIGGD